MPSGAFEASLGFETVVSVTVSETDEPMAIVVADRCVVTVGIAHAKTVVAPTTTRAAPANAPATPVILYLRLLMSSFLSPPIS